MKHSLFVPLLLAAATFCQGQKIQNLATFDGTAASQEKHPEFDIDPNGAVGTKQYLEWTNVNIQAYDKVTFAPLWPKPLNGVQPFLTNKLTECTNISGDGIVNFDRIASRWVIAGHTTGSNGKFYYCVAISNTDDLSSSSLAWYTYGFFLNPLLGTNAKGHIYFPDWPKLGTWIDAYYVNFDLEDPDNNYRNIGILACALDRSNMLTGAKPNPMQCFSDPSPIPQNGALYLQHSLIPADIEGVTAPPSGRDEFYLSIQNPPNNGQSTTSSTINLWDFHVDWSNPANSTFTNSIVAVPTYTPGCYSPSRPPYTVCVPEPSTSLSGSHYHIDSVGDRLMPRLSYRNFGTYESFLISHTVQSETNGSTQTGIRWYELRGSGLPALYQCGTVSPDTTTFRFMPSIAQDSAGNAIVGYSTSSLAKHPGIKASWWNLQKQTSAKEFLLKAGSGDEENTGEWGDYTSMTVDPVDGCTFWYVNEYFSSSQTGTQIKWKTRVSTFKLSSCM